ncbi:MAG: hypothetical protein KGI67_13825 [Pseudomonadota bacterium]|nr:hypothetical protein [Pseudomonadota bacterium]
MQPVPNCSQVLVLLGLALAVQAAAAAADTVYQRRHDDGAVTLTNVPDGAGYEVVATGSRNSDPAAGATMPGSTPAGAPALPLDAPKPAARLAAPATLPAPDVAVDMPPDRETAPARASLAASRAAEQIVAAGGTGARLEALYKASMSAFQAQAAARARP